MSGHSKWSSIKHKKAKKDAQKGNLFSKLSRKLTLEARGGGGDIESNSGLRMVVEVAQEAGMPKENIKKAIDRGTGEIPGVNYEEVTIEGYGPGGVALLIETVTDNKKRAVAQIRHILSIHGGHVGETGCVNWLFERKGSLVLNKKKIGEDQGIELAVEVGAEDIREEGDILEILFPANKFNEVRKKIEKIGIEPELIELTMIPQTMIFLEEKEALQMLRLMDALDESEEVQKVYGNFNIADEIMAEAS